MIISVINYFGRIYKAIQLSIIFIFLRRFTKIKTTSKIAFPRLYCSYYVMSWSKSNAKPNKLFFFLIWFNPIQTWFIYMSICSSLLYHVILLKNFLTKCAHWLRKWISWRDIFNYVPSWYLVSSHLTYTFPTSVDTIS